MHHSKREYTFAFASQLNAFTHGITSVKVPVDKLLKKDSNNDDELIYAMQDQIDEVLDLKVGESMYLSADRSCPEQTKGILIRTK